MTPSLRLILRRALEGSSSLPLHEQIQLWQGVAEILPEDESMGQAARKTLLALRESLSAQLEFGNLL